MIFDVRTISTLEKNKVSVPLGGITKEVLIKNFGEMIYMFPHLLM